jgi:hypothetical protein
LLWGRRGDNVNIRRELFGRWWCRVCRYTASFAG